MATPKVWTATDLHKGEIRIEQEGINVKFGFDYKFQDSNGDILTELPERTINLAMAISSLPPDIVDALLKIQTHLYESALEREGMD